MRHVVRMVVAIRFALSTRRDLLLEILASATNCTYSFVRIAAFAHLTVCSGWCCDSGGLGGETHWFWSSRPRSIGGIARGSIDAGAAARDVLADHASIQNVEA
jgi:hypothetical protein